jgi:long-chain acyl-CoA synthetase
MDPKNLRQLIEHRASTQPEKQFLFSEADGRSFTYSQFDQAVNRAAQLLLANDIAKGDVISLLLPNGVAYVIAYFACWKIGAIAGPVNSLLKPPEMAFVMAHCGAKALLVHEDFRPSVKSVTSHLSALRAIIPFDDEGRSTQQFEGAVDKLSSVACDRDDEAIIVYTSGTTGKPKGCLLTHGNLIANARQISQWLTFTEADRLLTVMPLFHMNAVSVTTLSAIYAGGSTVVCKKFSASRFWQTISNYQITSFGSVATMLAMLLAKFPQGVPNGLESEQLRFALCGSAPVPAEVIRRFEETFKCLVVEGYGLSESTCRSTFNPPDERRRPGSCGLPIGNEMKIFDDQDRELPSGKVGEIVLRGENILKGYYNDPAASAQAFRNGWFHTGDIGYCDADGFFYIVDRKSDMIIRGGENIYPREIDEVLYQHPAVSAAATIGVPDELYGEEVTAFVVLKEGANAVPADLINFCRQRLADYKCPKTVRLVRDIPRGPTGKLLKRELAREYSEIAD